MQRISDTKHWLRTAATISEALPYMRRFAGRSVVIKYGGHAMGDAALAQNFARDVVLLKQVGINPVVVHGGGPQIARMLGRLGIESDFVDGLRVTDAAAIEVVEMVLAGTINKQIVTTINAEGGTAVGLSGKDGRLIEATPLQRRTRDAETGAERVADLGFVGEPGHINVELLGHLGDSDIIPVIAPIGVGAGGETYNINADTAAGAIASALSAIKLLSAHRRPRRARRRRRARQPDDRRRGDANAHRRRGQRRYDPEARNLPRGDRALDRGRPHPGRARPARDPAGALHRARHRHHDRAGLRSRPTPEGRPAKRVGARDCAPRRTARSVVRPRARSARSSGASARRLRDTNKPPP